MRNRIWWKRGVVFTATAIGLAVSLSAAATPCPALQYEEMKDMSAEELTKEFCSAMANAGDSYSKALDINLKAGTKGQVDEAAAQALDAEGDQCRNQAERIKRVLGRKGIDTAGIRYDLTCKGKKL